MTLLKSVGLAAGCMLAAAPAFAADPTPSFNDYYIPEFTKNPGPYVAATAGSSASAGASAPETRSPMFPANASPAPSFIDYLPWGPAQAPAARRIARSPVPTLQDGTNADTVVQPTR